MKDVVDEHARPRLSVISGRLAKWIRVITACRCAKPPLCLGYDKPRLCVLCHFHNVYFMSLQKNISRTITGPNTTAA
jgi:hypothetical protein